MTDTGVAVLDRLPEPTWSGFDQASIEGLTAFVQARHNETGQAKIEEIRRYLADNERRIQATTESLRRYRQTFRTKQAELAAIGEDQDDTVLPAKAQELKQAIAQLPNFRGWTTCSLGLPVAAFDVAYDTNDDQYPFGTFEFHLAYCADRSHDISETLGIMHDYPGGTYPGELFTLDGYVEAGMFFASDHSTSNPGVLELTEAASPIDYITRLTSGLVNTQLVQEYLGSGQALTTQEPIRLYPDDGPWLDQAMLRFMEFLQGTHEERTATLQGEIDEANRRIERHEDDIRIMQNQTARSNRGIQQIESQQQPNPDQLQEHLDYITQLNGVLGARINAEQIEVHIRTRATYDNVHYDFGDWMITISHRGVRYVEYTRSPMLSPRRHTPLYQDGRSFCFGERSAEIQRLFDDGNYSGLVHVLINTIGNMNRSAREEGYLRRHRQINADDIWLNTEPEPEATQGVAGLPATTVTVVNPNGHHYPAGSPAARLLGNLAVIAA